MKKCVRWDKAYCEFNEKHFKDPKCKHIRTADYDSRGQAKVTLIRSVCIRCGRLSQWAKTTNHTVGGGFEYAVVF